MALPTLKDLSVAVGGFLGPQSAAYDAGVGGAVAGGLQKLKSSVLDSLYKAGAKLGSNLGTAAVVIPGAVSAGAQTTGPAASSALEQKFFGFSITQLLLMVAVVGGIFILWLTRSKR